MSEESIPEAVRSFLASHVSSMEELEVLLHMAAAPGEWRTAGQVYDAILSNPESIERRLEHFAANSIVEREASSTVRYRFAPKTEFRNVIEETAAMYRLKPVIVLRTIFASKIDPAQSFADAFRIRKD